ncbi:MAG: DUF523 domain-containing protein [Bacillota bacterium]|jgi:uncharacterized protein YbbK (DUF523 family)
MYCVSACLLGVKCKYDGGDNELPQLKELLAQGKALPVCPEQLGGLTTPRDAAEICGGSGGDVLLGQARVLTRAGRDVTREFIRGAQEVVRLCEIAGVSWAILKENSPSCGVSFIYDGSFQGRRIKGEGVTAALLRQKGIRIYNEKSWEKSSVFP